jgi:hypothetical protein
MVVVDTIEEPIMNPSTSSVDAINGERIGEWGTSLLANSTPSAIDWDSATRATSSALPYEEHVGDLTMLEPFAVPSQVLPKLPSDNTNFQNAFQPYQPVAPIWPGYMMHDTQLPSQPFSFTGHEGPFAAHNMLALAGAARIESGATNMRSASSKLLHSDQKVGFIVPSTRRPTGRGGMSKKRVASRSSPFHRLTERKTIGKRKGDSQKSRLLKAMDLVEQLKAILEADSRFASPIYTLEQELGREMPQEATPTPSFLSGDLLRTDADSGYHSSTSSYATREMPSNEDLSSLSEQFHDDSAVSSITSFRSEDGGTLEHGSMDMDTPRAAEPGEPRYHCTFFSNGKMCSFSTRCKGDWVRHEESEKHWPQKRYMCLMCIESVEGSDGRFLCPFCFEAVPTAGNNKMHYLQCQKAQKGRHVFAGARKEHFRDHLREHGMTNISPGASTWTFPVNSAWPRDCGFCDDRFIAWEVRADHVAAHFQQGASISTWKLPSRKGKRAGDSRPRNNDKWDGDDDSDDEDEFYGGGKGKRLSPSAFGGNSAITENHNSSSPYVPHEWDNWISDDLLELESKEAISRRKVERFLDQLDIQNQSPFQSAKFETSEAVHDLENVHQSSPRKNESCIPPPRKPDFVGRSVELQQLHKALSPSGSCCVLTGLSGVGKTAIAVEYTHRFGSIYDHIFWIDSTGNNLETNFLQISKPLGLSTNPVGNQDVRDEAIQSIQNTLERLEMPWLLIFDKIESADAFNIHKYWPTGTNGSLLITTCQNLPSANAETVRCSHIDIKPLMKFQENGNAIERMGRGNRVLSHGSPGAGQIPQAQKKAPSAPTSPECRELLDSRMSHPCHQLLNELIL